VERSSIIFYFRLAFLLLLYRNVAIVSPISSIGSAHGVAGSWDGPLGAAAKPTLICEPNAIRLIVAHKEKEIMRV